MMKSTSKNVGYLLRTIVPFLSFLLLNCDQPAALQTESPAIQKAENAVETVWVAKKDGSKSCEPGSGSTLKDAETELAAAGIKVLKSQKDSNDLMHIQMCGAETGSVNRFEILKADLPKAQAKNFYVWGK